MPRSFEIFSSRIAFSISISLFWLLLALRPVWADDLSISVPYIPSLINIEYGRDSDEGRDLSLFANLAITPGHRISFTYGDRDETVRDTQEALNTNTYAVGYAFHSIKNYRLGVDYKHWGEENKITTDTLSAYIALDWHEFTFTISPEYRQIDVYTDAKCSGSIDNTAVNYDVKYYPNRYWGVSAAYVVFDYSQERDELLNCATSEDIPYLVGRLKTVADDNQMLLGINLFLYAETYSLDWARVESAIDGDTTYIMSAHIATDRLDDWTLALRIGTQDNYDDTTTDFIVGSLTYYW
ncbi:hypothetical protein [Kaarinaea lacus]